MGSDGGLLEDESDFASSESVLTGVSLWFNSSVPLETFKNHGGSHFSFNGREVLNLRLLSYVRIVGGRRFR